MAPSSTIPRCRTTNVPCMREGAGPAKSHRWPPRAFEPWVAGMNACYGYGVGGSGGENWPAYYALRGARGERRSLDKAPGHVFDGNEKEAFVRFLAQVMENAWDADVLVVPKIKRIHVSHDEWLELRSTTPTDFAPVAV